jgi:hypothetical protein
MYLTLCFPWIFVLHIYCATESSVCIATAYYMDGRDSVPSSVQSGCGPHPQRRAVSPELKRQGLESDHPPAFSAEIKNGEAAYLLSPIRLHGLLIN